MLLPFRLRVEHLTEVSSSFFHSPNITNITIIMTNLTIQVINYELIRARHPDELLKLAEACRPPPTGLGFFRLDLRMRLPKRAITEINAATRDYFAQPEKVKVQEGISKHTGKQRLWLSTIEALEVCGSPFMTNQMLIQGV